MVKRQAQRRGLRVWRQPSEPGAERPSPCSAPVALVGLAFPAHTLSGHFARDSPASSYKCSVCMYVCIYVHVFPLGHRFTYVHLCNVLWPVGPVGGPEVVLCSHVPIVHPPGESPILPPPHSHRVGETRGCIYAIPGLQFGKEIGFAFLTPSFTSYKL